MIRAVDPPKRGFSSGSSVSLARSAAIVSFNLPAATARNVLSQPFLKGKGNGSCRIAARSRVPGIGATRSAIGACQRAGGRILRQCRMNGCYSEQAERKKRAAHNVILPACFG
jgi:hypothetical protein